MNNMGILGIIIRQVKESMNESMFVQRAQYDSLVRNYPHWMEVEWPNVQRTWSIGGVRIRSHLDIVRKMLDSLNVGRN